MKTYPETIMAVFLFSVLLLSGCIPPGGVVSRRGGAGPGSGGGASPAREMIGTIEAPQGPDVTVGGRPARAKMAVYSGEEVRTGAGSTVFIRFNGGGVMFLNERTDPIFALISQTLCIVFQMFTGHAQLDSEGRCIQGDTPESEAFVHSKVDITVQGGHTIWKVLEGRIEVTLKRNRQVKLAVIGGNQVTVRRERVEAPQKIAVPELNDLRSRFMTMPPPSTRPGTAPIR